MIRRRPLPPFAAALCGLVLAAAAAVAPRAAAQADHPTTPAGREPVQLLFIHHSCGGQLMADVGERVGGGPETGELCIYESHPNGGGLRAMLQQRGYQVNEASYGSIVGEDTDIRHWNAKFRDQMDRILRTKRQDALLPDGVTNSIVAFKSCFPNNAFTGPGSEPGDPDGPELTVANAKAAYRALLPHFREHPEVLYIGFTAPPLADRKPVGIKQKIKAMFSGKPKHPELALEFNRWLTDRENGWLAGYDLPNVTVFDYYGVLADPATGWSAYPTQGGQDSHPSSEGNGKAAEVFLGFLKDAWAL
ncbi:MAG: hypothetical protein ABR506_02625, partial [Candidatus Krumholzibacteriia bacterium]